MTDIKVKATRGAILAFISMRHADGWSTSRDEIHAIVCRLGTKIWSKARHNSRRVGFANSILRELCESRVIHVAEKGTKYYLGPRPTSTERPAERIVSMIYELPTNDIPVDRLAASVIGPVWGSSSLL